MRTTPLIRIEDSRTETRPRGATMISKVAPAALRARPQPRRKAPTSRSCRHAGAHGEERPRRPSPCNPGMVVLCEQVRKARLRFRIRCKRAPYSSSIRVLDGVFYAAQQLYGL